MVAVLVVHLGLAVSSLLRENPTVDEVAHLPAGLTYWQKGTFRLYPQNPPLVKLAAALPVLVAKPAMSRIYTLPSWSQRIHASIAHEFAVDNATRYFELFTLGRLVIPLFSLLGGLVVFAWSRRLHGDWAGLLSLSLWAFCPNILAHGRLITTDVGATSLGVLATYVFWRFLHDRASLRAGMAGGALGLAILAKFSSLVLVGLWPVLALAYRFGLGGDRRGGWLRHAALAALAALLVVNIGYGFEGTFRPLGRFEFASRALTGARRSTRPIPVVSNPLQARVLRFRENRFRLWGLGWIPAPLPAPFLEGLDLQKLDAEGIPERYLNPSASEDAVAGYPVYLNGVLRSRGWWYYYLAALAYKVPEGTWMLGLASLALLTGRFGRASWRDDLAVGIVPVAILLAMSFGTDINLGLRYILPAFPYAFVAMGRLAPWAARRTGRSRKLAVAFIAAALLETVGSTLWIHPHYLAYFNAISGGARHGSAHLIDSNLDWGQDLVNLRDWLRTNAPGERVGLAYFGQINPNILKLRNEGFDWFLPAPEPGSIRPLSNPALLEGPPAQPGPGLYAVSASFVRGLPYAIYDPSMQVPNLYPGWDSRGTPEPRSAFGYFADLVPIAQVGYSIYVYRVSPAEADALALRWRPR